MAHEFSQMSLRVFDPSDPRYETSRRAGFRGGWFVQGIYEIDAGVLRGVPKAGMRQYYPITHREIGSALAKIEEGNEKALLKFAHTYGNLGFTLIAEQGWLATTGEHEPVPPDEKQHSPERKPAGDPLPWIWAHARTIRFCLRMLELIQNEDDDGLKDYLKTYQWQGRDYRKEGLTPLIPVAFRDKVFEGHGFGSLGKQKVRVYARWVLRFIINENISEIRRVLEPEGDRDRSYFEYRALIEVVYWHLADALDDGTVKRCEAEGCGSIFVRTDERQRFCPPMNLDDPKAESTCAVRQRARDRRKETKKKASRKERGLHGKIRR